MIELVLTVPLFLCWGSFLNALAYRLIAHQSLFTRSACPTCRKTIAWYDLIPVISFVILKGRCRSCHKRISWLYPFIEILTAFVLSLMVMRTPPAYWPAYIFFFSALIVSVRTDLEHMIISRLVSLYAVPAGVLFTYTHALPITSTSSIIGAAVGYGSLWLIKELFFALTHKEGLGQGDLDLLAFIGAFVGIMGVFPTLLIASTSGALFGIICIITGKASRKTRIPFGPFLALGAGMVVFRAIPSVLSL